MDELLEKLQAGDRRALARLISRVEDRDPRVRSVLSQVYDARARIRSIGITGPPGAGKSTLTDQLIALIRERGQSVAIAAIDPSSPFSGGAVLGDRIRMNRHATDEGVFIRSFGTRGTLGGLSSATREVLHLFAAAGFDWAIVETVGVGQSELDIMDVADTTVVVLVPEAGDTVQTMKAGLLEIADVFVVNKADRDGARRMQADLENMVHLQEASEWNAPVLLTQAGAGKGVSEVLDAATRHQDAVLGTERWKERRARARRAEFVEVIVEELRARTLAALESGELEKVARALTKGETNPYAAALEVLGDPEVLARLVKKPAE